MSKQTLAQTGHKCSQDNRKTAKMNAVTLPDGQVMKEVDENQYKYLGVMKVDETKEHGMKDIQANIRE